MMNNYVPDFGVDQDNGCDELAEILWQKGPILRRFPPPSKPEEVAPPPGFDVSPCELFMREDELASWLHLPAEDVGLVQPPPSEIAAPASQTSTVVDSNEVLPSERTANAGEDGRKRKVMHSDHSDDEAAEHDPFESKRRYMPRPPARRTRAAEVHNLSERRRRDRINDKMKELQQLIPRCNKTDKASMLDDAVEYLKSLQLQIQMMSMGCAMPPMMFPGIAPMGMFMGMGMEPSASGMPTMPFPRPADVGSSGGHFRTGMPLQAFRPPHGFSDGQPSSALPNVANPFFPYFGLPQMPSPVQDHAGTSKSTVETENPPRSS